jgi:hypothetical protein
VGGFSGTRDSGPIACGVDPVEPFRKSRKFSKNLRAISEMLQGGKKLKFVVL